MTRRFHSQRDFTDAELVARSIGGDRSAFGELIERYLDASYAVAYALTGCRSESDDLVQEAFLGALQGLDRLESHGKFGPWLTGILRRLDANRRRTARRRLEILRDFADRRERQRLNVTVDPSDDDELWSSIETLPTDLRVPLVLFYFEGESTAAVASHLDLTPAAARKRVQLARDRLRERLGTRASAPLARPSLQRLRPSKSLRTAMAVTVASAPFGGSLLSAQTLAAVDRSFEKSTHRAETVARLNYAAKVAAIALLTIGGVLFYAAVRSGSAVDREGRTTPVAERTESRTGSGTTRDESPPLAHAEATPVTASTASVVESLHRRAHISGRLRLADGTPITEAEVFLGRSRQPWGFAESTPVDEDGRFHFAVDNEEDRWLYLLVDHAFVCPPDSWLQPRFDSQQDLEFVLDPGHVLSGVVTNEAGEPLSRARLTLETPEPNQQGEALIETDARGVFAIPFLPSGDYQLSVSHPKHSRRLERIRLSEDQQRTIELSAPRALKLEIDGLVARGLPSPVQFSLKRGSGGADANLDALANREELLFRGEPNPEGTVTLACPPPGHWVGTFYGTLPKRRFALTIPVGTRDVRARVDLEDGAYLSGAIRIDGGTRPTDAVLVDILGPGGRGGELIAPLEGVGVGQRYVHDGIPAGTYLAGVAERIAGYPADRSQPEWVFYAIERVQLSGVESHTLDLALPTSQPVHVRLAQNDNARSTSYTALTITPMDHRELFTFLFEPGGIEPQRGVGALAIVSSERTAVFDHLPAGRYRIEASIDGCRARPVEVFVADAGEPIDVALTRATTVRRAFTVTTPGRTPLELRVQCPPAPSMATCASGSAWRREYASWLADATIRDRVDPEFARHATLQHFARPYNDFAVGWHYSRSVVVRDVRFEGTLKVSPDGQSILEIPVDLDPSAIVRISADGFRPVELRAVELLEAATSPLVLPLAAR